MPPLGTDRIDGWLRFEGAADAANTARTLEEIITTLRETGVEPQILSHRQGRSRIFMRIAEHAYALLTLSALPAPDGGVPQGLHLHARFFHRVIFFRRRRRIVVSGLLILAGAALGLVPVVAIWHGWLLPQEKSRELLWFVLYFVGLPLLMVGVMIGNGCANYVREWMTNALDLSVIRNADYGDAVRRWEMLAAALTRLMVDEPDAERVRLFAPDMTARHEYRRTVQAPAAAREGTLATLAAYAKRACDMLNGSGIEAACDVARDELKMQIRCEAVEAQVTLEWTREPALHRDRASDTARGQLSVIVSAVVRPLLHVDTLRIVIACGSACVWFLAAFLAQLNFFRYLGVYHNVIALYSVCCGAAGYWFGTHITDLAEWYIGRRVARDETYLACVRTLDEFVNNVDGLLRTQTFTLLF